ncbi:LmbE family protein [Candidatus Magnetobacterium bavaricum]|uniref:LmbE family protein n=1 Tax=Candidatus Magnetobacterium bavaricum TaxID=29290 RepID=A0A0F3GJK3_9BACT|nr:LmbE family protein [Candidatus Magnetobacterium bavaricum]
MGLLNNKRIIFFSAHLDDSEFGCGATISRYSGKADIYLVGLSLNRRDSCGNIQEIRDKEEAFNAAEALNISRNKVLFPNREIAGQLFPEYRQSLLESLYYFSKYINPHIVFVPSINDIHQDHRAVAETALKAFKRGTVIGYEIVNSVHKFSPNMFIAVDEISVLSKCKAIQCYKSQMNPEITTADYFSDDIIACLAKVRGARSGSLYAEAFEVYTMNILLEDI